VCVYQSGLGVHWCGCGAWQLALCVNLKGQQAESGVFKNEE